eukprot:764674-Hanusia_phi.AAC.2
MRALEAMGKFRRRPRKPLPMCSMRSKRMGRKDRLRSRRRRSKQRRRRWQGKGRSARRWSRGARRRRRSSEILSTHRDLRADDVLVQARVQGWAVEAE